MNKHYKQATCHPGRKARYGEGRCAPCHRKLRKQQSPEYREKFNAGCRKQAAARYESHRRPYELKKNYNLTADEYDELFSWAGRTL